MRAFLCKTWGRLSIVQEDPAAAVLECSECAQGYAAAPEMHCTGPHMALQPVPGLGLTGLANLHRSKAAQPASLQIQLLQVFLCPHALQIAATSW